MKRFQFGAHLFGIWLTLGSAVCLANDPAGSPSPIPFDAPADDRYLGPWDGNSIESEYCDCGQYPSADVRGCGLLPSDHAFDRFVSPISNPFYFEDPRSLTEVRGMLIVNHLPNTIGGGNAEVWAAQLRARFADRWSVIAPRFAHLQVKPSDDGAPNGYLATPIGLKWNFYRDVPRQRLASAGITYFIPGSEGALSHLGDGDFHVFLTGGAEICDDGHWLSATGLRLPADSNWGTQLLYWSNQWDYEFVDRWYGILGVNWFHWTRDAGLDFTNSVTALDLIDIPTQNVAGTDVVTSAVGARWKASPDVEIGSGFEFPLTKRTDILRNRLYVDFTWRY